MRGLGALLFIAAVAAAPAAAQDTGLVAVLPMAVSGGRSDLQLETLTEAVRTATGDALSPLGYTVLTGDNTLRVLADNGVDPSKACESTCALEVARELKARLFITGTVSAAEGDLVAFVRLFDALTGRQMGSVQLDGRNLKELRLAFAQRAADFFRTTVANLKTQGDVPTEPVVASVPLLVKTLDLNDTYKIEVGTAEGVRRCARDVAFISPCKLRVPPGPVQLLASAGSLRADAAFEPGAGAVVTVRRSAKSGLWTAGLVGTIVGGVAVYGCGLALGLSYEDSPEARTPLMGCIGGGVSLGLLGALGLIVADDLPVAHVEWPKDGVK